MENTNNLESTSSAVSSADDSSHPKVHILVCYHKPSPILSSAILYPMLVGASNASSETINELESMCAMRGTKLLRDDRFEGKECDNISALNPYFCELSAMYWAWKNLDSDYYGLFHYRRILDLKHECHIQKEPITTSRFMRPKSIIKHFGLGSEAVSEICKYDIILPALQPSRLPIRPGAKETKALSLYDFYDELHYKQDLDKCIAYIKAHYPQMQEALQTALHTKPCKWYIANMFVMKKELYLEYCAWLFEVLFGVQDTIPYQSYDSYQARVFGFLSERLFNIWIEYKKSQGITYKEVPIVLLYAKKPLFGFKEDGTYRRFFFAGIRIYKKRL